jgi:glycosyltransferase involved in cell wall biosynthesis
LNIAVNTRLLIKNKLDGIGWFSHETLKRIVLDHPEHNFFFFFDRKYDESFVYAPNVTPIVLYPQARHPFLFYLWFEWSVPYMLKKIKADVFLSPDGYLSLRTDVKQIAVIHDLNFIHYPDDLPMLVRKYYNYYFPKFAHKASAIATVSEFSKNDIVDKYKVQTDKIDVVFNGVNESYKASSAELIAEIRLKYTSGAPYFLFIGSLHPRKNLVNLFKAFDKFRAENGDGIKLLVVGRRMWWTGAIKEAFDGMSYNSEVIFIESLAVQELNYVISSALAMTYVSNFEGFGIPILEGMACGVPVITSNVTSMPEVAGGAALEVDPFSVESIKNGLLAIAGDEELRNTLVQKGRERIKAFSWDKTSTLLWNTIEKVIAKKN